MPMSNDDPKAFERALSAIVQDIIANAPRDVGVAATKLEIPVPSSDDAATIVKGAVSSGPSVFEWITTVKKQLAPHADKVPVPVVQGIAKVFPPAGAAVPILRYIQTPPSSKGSGSAAAALPAASQIYIIPITTATEAQAPKPVNPQVEALRRTAVRLAQFCRTNPALALLVAYGLYRARNVPGNTVRALDRLVNRVCLWLYGWVLRRTERQRVWVAKQVERVRAQIAGMRPRTLGAQPGGTAPERVQEGENDVQLDVGDAVWVVVTILAVLYVTYDRKNIFRRSN